MPGRCRTCRKRIRMPPAPVNEGSRESRQVRGVGTKGWRATAWELSPPEQRDPGQRREAAFLLARHIRHGTRVDGSPSRGTTGHPAPCSYRGAGRGRGSRSPPPSPQPRRGEPGPAAAPEVHSPRCRSSGHTTPSSRQQPPPMVRTPLRRRRRVLRARRRRQPLPRPAPGPPGTAPGPAPGTPCRPPEGRTSPGAAPRSWQFTESQDGFGWTGT